MSPNTYPGKLLEEEGVAEAELEADVRTSLRKFYYSISGDSPSLDSWLLREPTKTLLEAFDDPDPFPGWLSETELDYFIENFDAGGFRGPLNRYRNQERDFHNLPEMGVKKVEQSSCLIAGSKDVVRFFVPNVDVYKNLGDMHSDFRFSKIIEGSEISQYSEVLATRLTPDFVEFAVDFGKKAGIKPYSDFNGVAVVPGAVKSGGPAKFILWECSGDHGYQGAAGRKGLGTGIR